MATSFELDDKLIQQAVKIGGHRTKREAVNAALEAYVAARGRQQLIELMGTIEYAPEVNERLDRKLAEYKTLGKTWPAAKKAKKATSRSRRKSA